MSNWYIKDKDLVFASGGVLRFQKKIAEAVQLGPIVVVRLDTDEPRQVFGVRGEKVVWQAPKVPQGFGIYVSVAVLGTRLFVWDFGSLRIELDPNDGTVLGIANTK